MSLAAGSTIGNYRVISKIGTGGMGAVYLAEHPLIGKKVALKVIHKELAGNHEVVKRFFQEAQAVNKIGNEHIVEIHDFGVTPEGDHFYIMEYLEGLTLASVLTTERVMDVMRALHVGAQIAGALAAAHASGVIHRDLKPDNIMLMHRTGNPDFVKVLDFGLAKMFQGNGASAVQTAAGVLLGTPQYMSPEACESKRDIDHRTDIYALGILLFQMMTGRLPFEGESMGEILVKQVQTLPPGPRGFNPSIPPSVEQVILRCLAKPPDGRFPTMNSLRDALLDPEAYLHTSPPIAPARSVAPGEARSNARDVIAAADARTRIQQGRALPLPAQPSQMSSQMSSQQTMIEGAHFAPSLGMPDTPMQQVRLATQGVQPNAPKMNTMRIATPLGYTSTPPRKVWPVVLVIGLLLGLGAGGVAVALRGRGDAKAPAEAAVASVAIDAAPADARSQVPVVTPLDAAIAAAAPVDSAVAAAPTVVKLTLESNPDGATVQGPDGKVLGKTPLKLEWPSADTDLELTFRLRGYRDKKTTLSVKSNAMTRVELSRLPVPPIEPTVPKNPSQSPDTQLERPD